MADKKEKIKKTTDEAAQVAASSIVKEPKIVQTDAGSKIGQDKCPKCGATDISPVDGSGKLRCNFCRHVFEPEKVQGLEEDIENLSGEILGSGAKDIVADAKDVITLKCSSCGAEVVIDTSEAKQARCHWCRNTLSINQQIPNGAIPDVVLPFKLTKQEAQKQIETFVGKRKFYAHPLFRKEFTTENIMGVYFPYMLIDVNSHAKLVGQGEHLLRRYTVGSGDNRETYYDAELYDVEREFDLTIEGLTIESNSDKLDNTSKNKTNNVINSIMPFDTENCVKWNANYLKGYSSEKRDVNINQLRPLVETQSKDISRFAANETLKHYDRGVAWSQEEFKVKGQQWQAAYLPVWLYSYQQISGSKKILHYVAVNARTNETMGSVPIHMPKLFIISFIVEILGLIAMLAVDWDYNWIFLLSGFIYYGIIYGKYRNAGARHNHETETKHTMKNLNEYDKYVETRKRLSNSVMRGANNKRVNGASTKKSFVDQLKDGVNNNIIK